MSATIVDVVIGLAFLYFLLSLVCSAINEFIAGALRLRARNLEAGIAGLLGDADMKDRLFEHALIKPLGPLPRRDRSRSRQP